MTSVWVYVDKHSVLTENTLMGIYTTRRRSFREVGRFMAVDQDGKPHVLVERVSTRNDVGAGGKVIDSEHGASHFYSATSGDAVVRACDGSFVGSNGDHRLVLRRAQ